MPYDPNMMLQLGQYGMGMLGPQGGGGAGGMNMGANPWAWLGNYFGGGGGTPGAT